MIDLAYLTPNEYVVGQELIVEFGSIRRPCEIVELNSDPRDLSCDIKVAYKDFNDPYISWVSNARKRW